MRCRKQRPDRHTQHKRRGAWLQYGNIMIEERVRELKTIIDNNDGHNAADASFARAVDDLVHSVYDNIGEVRCIPARTLFDLFVIKVLYVQRGSRHADVIDYLGALLATFVDVRELFPQDERGPAAADLLQRHARPRAAADGCWKHLRRVPQIRGQRALLERHVPGPRASPRGRTTRRLCGARRRRWSIRSTT